MRLCLPLLLVLSVLPLAGQARPTTVDGDVVNALTGDPIPGARVKLTSGPADPLFAAADARGHFQFTGLTHSSYSLLVEHPAFLPFSPVPVNAGRPVKVSLTAGAIISGTVTDPNGLPASPNGAFFIQFYTKRAKLDGAMELHSTHIAAVDDRGQYRSAPLEPGTYYVEVKVQRTPTFWDRTWRTTYYPGALDAESAKPVVLAAGQQAQADIQVLRVAGVTVSGRVSIPATLAPAPGRRVGATVHLAGSSNAIVAVEGDRFEVKDLVPGKYTVVAETFETGTAGGAPKPLFGTLRQVEIGQHDISNLDLDLQPLPQVSGTVTFAQGCPPAPVRVMLRSDGIAGLRGFFATAGPDGTFTFDSFTPGPLYVSAPPMAASVWLGDREITRSGFDYPTATPQPLRVVVNCAGGAQ